MPVSTVQVEALMRQVIQDNNFNTIAIITKAEEDKRKGRRGGQEVLFLEQAVQDMLRNVIKWRHTTLYDTYSRCKNKRRSRPNMSLDLAQQYMMQDSKHQRQKQLNG
jgi:hypothetical protein